MIEQLFGSKTRVKLLKLFYSNPNRSFYVREITRKIDEQINSVRRELSNLLSIGIIASDTTNNRLYYEVNQNYEFYHPLSVIFGGATTEEVKETAIKTDAEKEPELSELRGIGNVEFAMYTGQFTRDEASGIDLLIVGDVNQTRLNKFISDLEASESKEIRYVAMPSSEFQYRRQVKDRFLSTVLSSKKQVLIDKNQVVTEE
jgi:hypothetical protein